MNNKTCVRQKGNIVWPTGTSWRISVSYEFQGFATKDFKKAKEYKERKLTFC